MLFTKSAATKEAHGIAIEVAKALAITGARIVIDDNFMAEVSPISQQLNLHVATHPGPYNTRSRKHMTKAGRQEPSDKCKMLNVGRQRTARDDTFVVVVVTQQQD